MIKRHCTGCSDNVVSPPNQKKRKLACSDDDDKVMAQSRQAIEKEVAELSTSTPIVATSSSKRQSPRRPGMRTKRRNRIHADVIGNTDPCAFGTRRLCSMMGMRGDPPSTMMEFQPGGSMAPPVYGMSSLDSPYFIIPVTAEEGEKEKSMPQGGIETIHDAGAPSSSSAAEGGGRHRRTWCGEEEVQNDIRGRGRRRRGEEEEDDEDEEEGRHPNNNFRWSVRVEIPCGFSTEQCAIFHHLSGMIIIYVFFMTRETSPCNPLSPSLPPSIQVVGGCLFVNGLNHQPS
jgi:hypothetical protein